MARKTKQEANYREAANKARSCGTCSMFLPLLHRCTLVKGDIRAGDVCAYWERDKQGRGKAG